MELLVDIKASHTGGLLSVDPLQASFSNSDFSMSPKLAILGEGYNLQDLEKASSEALWNTKYSMSDSTKAELDTNNPGL